MLKLDRNYVLGISSFNKGPLDVFVNLPFTIEFDITRTTLTSANVCQIRIYNLSNVTRNKIRKDSFDFDNFRSIELKAGYGNNLATIFSGNISQAWSTREGTNFITQIECFDGGFAYVNGDVNITAPGGTPINILIAQIAAYLPHVTIGSIGNYPGVLARGNTFSGNAMYILSQLTNGGAYIDKGKFYALTTNEYVASLNTVGVISTDSGLLGTPVLEASTVHFDMIFEPGLTIGQQVVLFSETAAPGFNGTYKVTGVKHRGTISAAVSGTAITTGEFFYNKAPSPVADAINLDVRNIS